MSNEQTGGVARAVESTNPDGRSPEEIQQGIRQTRMQLDSTLDAIQQRLSPGSMADEAIRYMRGSGANEFARNLSESVKRNPLPVALMGVSMAWLMWSGREGQQYPASHLGDSHDMRDRLGEVGDSAREQAERLKEGVSQQGARLKEGVRQGAEQAARVREGARQGAEQVRDSFETMLRDQPLLLAALGVAAGAALGALLPPTRQEDELMGEASEELGETAKQQMHLQLRKGKRVVEAASDAAKEEVQDTGQQAQNEDGYQAQRRADGADGEDVYPTPGL
jgi:ElaB/YqjD/DUF883 family membrane-anchored ribosome-binding protein